MDPNKWRIKKIQGLWYVYAPGEDFFPDIMTDNFEEALVALPHCQKFRYQESKRWRDG